MRFFHIHVSHCCRIILRDYDRICSILYFTSKTCIILVIHMSEIFISCRAHQRCPAGKRGFICIYICSSKDPYSYSRCFVFCIGLYIYKTDTHITDAIQCFAWIMFLYFIQTNDQVAICIHIFIYGMLRTYRR